jgi:hypothetical protein
MTLEQLMDAGEIRLRPQVAVGEQAVGLLLERVQNTLSSDVAGLVAPQNLAAIVAASAAFRPIVTTARQVPLTNRKLTYPQVTSRPTAAKQTAQKTEAGGGAKLAATQASVDADSYSSSGDLSWQAAKWAEPDLIELWMTLASQSYAKATEQAAAAALVAGVTATETVSASTLAAWMSAITTAAATIQASDYLADVIYADPETAGELAALAYAVAPGAASIAGLRLVSSNGLTASGPVAFVGYSQALLCGEAPNAPIQLRAVEPAIGGIEVGVIGSFAAAVADPAAFVKLTAT